VIRFDREGGPTLYARLGPPRPGVGGGSGACPPQCALFRARRCFEEGCHGPDGAWSQHQARILRGLAGAGLRLPNDLDLQHVAEEIEDLGNEQRFAAESNLVQAFVHLIKAAALPEGQAVRHWTKETRAFLYNAARRYRPSMRRDFDHKKLWSDARRLAAGDLRDDEHPVPPLPKRCPFGLDELVGGGADPREMFARLRAAAAASGPAPGGE
jgi:hypothetical protein